MGSMWKVLTIISLLFSTIALICLVFVWIRWQYTSPDVGLIKRAKEDVDAVNMALQVGRLDIISLLLAMFGLLFALAFIGWMSLLRAEAQATVREVSEKEAQKRLDDFISGEAATIIQGYLDLVAYGGDNVDPDEIGKHAGDGDNGKRS